MIPSETLQKLEHVVVRARVAVPTLPLDSLVTRGKQLLPTVAEAADLELPARRLLPLGPEIEASHGLVGRTAFAEAFIATLALERAPWLDGTGLPDSVLERYPAVYARLASYLMSGRDASYWVGDDAFLKDLRIAGGFSVSGAGAQDIDLVGTVSKGSGLKAMVKQREFRNGLAVLRVGGPAWFTVHTDHRYIEEFNEAGWDACYLRTADLLRVRPEVKGLVGTSWFYDPQLETISPRLLYLRKNPLSRGAFMICNGPAAVHTERATRKSEARRKAYEEGKYHPACFTIVWPRAALLAWADSVREPSAVGQQARVA